MLVKIWRKGNACILLVETYIGSVTMQSNIEVPQKIENRPTK